MTNNIHFLLTVCLFFSGCLQFGETKTTTTISIRTLDDFLNNHKLPYLLDNKKKESIENVLNNLDINGNRRNIESIIGISDIEKKHKTLYKEDYIITYDCIYIYNIDSRRLNSAKYVIFTYNDNGELIMAIDCIKDNINILWESKKN